MEGIIKSYFNEKDDKPSTLSLIVFYLALVGIHSLMILWMRGPLYVADETGYLGNARFLSGKGLMPNLVGCAFYHAGYSFLISPAFYFFSDPQKVYLTVLVINSFLTSSLFLFLYYWLRKFFLFDSRKSLLASFITCLYPAFLLNSNIAVAENAIIPLFVLPMIFLYSMIKHKSLWFGFLFGFSVSFLYTIHPRSLILLPIAGLYLIGLALFRVLPGRVAVISLITLLLNYLTTVELNRYLEALGWGSSGTVSIPDILGTYQNLNRVVGAIVIMFGQLWYITVSTYGLWLLGLMVIVLKIWQGRFVLKQKESFAPVIHAFIFYLLSCGGILLTSTLYLSHLWVSGSALIYGRYNESFIAAGAAVGLGTVLENKFDGTKQKTLRLITILILFALSMITLVMGVKWINHPTLTGAIHWLGVFPILGAIQFKLKLSFFTGIFIYSLYALGMMILLGSVFKAKRIFGITVLGSLFLLFTLVQYIYLFVPLAKRVESFVLPGIIREMPSVKTVSYDLAYKGVGELYRYQYFLPYTRFLLFNSSKNEFSDSEYFISSRFSEESLRMGAHVVALEKEGDLALWVKKGACP